MTLMTAIVAGLICGYFFGLRPRPVIVFLLVWTLVLLFQTFVALDAEDVPPEAWVYVPVQVVILLAGAVMTWLGSKVRSRFVRQPTGST